MRQKPVRPVFSVMLSAVNLSCGVFRQDRTSGLTTYFGSGGLPPVITFSGLRMM